MIVIQYISFEAPYMKRLDVTKVEVSQSVRPKSVWLEPHEPHATLF